jgi:hypothetical protein
MGVPRLRKGGGDVLFSAANEWIEQIRGAFVQHRQAHPRRKMAHPGAFARSGRPGQEERDGEGRLGAQQVRRQRREIAIGVDQFRVIGGVVLRLGRRQADADSQAPRCVQLAPISVNRLLASRMAAGSQTMPQLKSISSIIPIALSFDLCPFSRSN